MKTLGEGKPGWDAIQALLDKRVLDLPADLIDLLPIGVYVCDSEGRIIRFNSQAARLWGREPVLGVERFCGARRLYDTDGGFVEHKACPMADVLATGAAIHNGQIIVERQNGSRFLALANIQPLTDEDGRVIGAVNCFCDVSELRRSPAIVEDEHRARDLLNAVAVAIYTTDPEGRITFYNEAAAELWGVRPEIGESQFCGSWKLFTMDGTPLPHDQCPMAVALRERRPVRGAEAMAERPDGTRVPFMPFPTPLYDGNGAFVGAVNVLVDVTERRRAEEARLRGIKEQAILYRFTDGLYRARLPDEAYRVALDAIGAVLNCTRASILLFDDGGTARFVASHGLSERYCRAVEGHSPWRPGEKDAQPVCIDDVAASAELGELKATILQEGIGAMVFVPITVDEGVIGKFMAYFDAPHHFTEHDLELAFTIARQLGFFIARSRADEARRHSEQASRLLAAIVDSSEDAIFTKDLRGIITSWNHGAQRLYGYSGEEVIGKPVTVLIPPERQSEVTTILEKIRNGQSIDHYETVRRCKDGTLVDISLSVSPVKDAHGRIIGASKIARDITERRRAQDQQRMLLREMNHRIKNLFTLASSVVGLSQYSADSVEGLATAVRSRLGALARAHALTLPGSAGGEATLHALIATIVAPYQGERARVVIEGADCPVGGSAVTSLALLFNEFATNAAKYGSLSKHDGVVTIACNRDGDVMQIVWTERGGPPVEEPARVEGFGTMLAEETVKRQLGGELFRDWHPEGLVIRLNAAVERFAS